jgi:hypothetical protein
MAGTSVMITGRSHPMIARRTHACPAIVNPGTAVGPVRCPAAHPPGPPPARLPPPQPDRVISDKLVQVLVFGCGYRRIADQACSATTLRRRRDEWITLGRITKAPCGGQTAGPSRWTGASRGSSAQRSRRRKASGWARWQPRPTAVTTGCWPRPWTPWSWSACRPPSRWCIWTPAMTTSPAGRS